MTTGVQTLPIGRSVNPMMETKSANIYTDSVFRNIKFQSPSLEKVWLPTLTGYIQLLLNDICYFKADNMMTRLFKSNGQTVCINQSLKVLEEVLGPKGFVRTHKSYMVNIYNICKYVKKDGGYLTMGSDEKVPISRRNKWKLTLSD